ncbi:hypothetical protein J5751_07455 [bacterium]|nr:hypothetical protein [bacterium]
MEQKKQLITKVIEKIKPYWSKAVDILKLLNNKTCDEKTIDEIIKRISNAIKKCKKQNNIESLKK